MNKIFRYGLITLVLLAFNYKTLDLYFNFSDNSISLSQDFDSEKTESEMSDEKNLKDEKKDFNDYVASNRTQALIPDNYLFIIYLSKLKFANSDYSKLVYSPPESTSL